MQRKEIIDITLLDIIKYLITFNELNLNFLKSYARVMAYYGTLMVLYEYLYLPYLLKYFVIM